MTESPHIKTPRRAGLTLLAVSVLSLTLVAVSAWVALRRFRLPAPTGPYAVGTRILALTDSSRHEDESADPEARRQLVVQLWYPAARSGNGFAAYARRPETRLATAYEGLLQTNSRLDAPISTQGKAFPVLIFGARWNGERTQNTDLAEELASHGYVVAAVDHPYNASRVELGDGQVIAANPPLEGLKGEAATASERIAYWDRTLDLWAADDRFVLDRLAAMNRDATSPLRGRLDTEHAGAFGHSFGGAAALRLCGLDPRIRAAVNLDGWSFGALASRTAAQPVMLIYEHVALERNKELLTLPSPGTVMDQLDRSDKAAVEASLTRFGGYRLYVVGTQHLDFTDQPLLPPLHRGSFTGPIAPLKVQKIVRAYVLDFFDRTLHGQPSKLLPAAQSPFPEVTVDSFAPR